MTLEFVVRPSRLQRARRGVGTTSSFFAAAESPGRSFEVALFDEPQRGSIPKPRVAQRTLGLENNENLNPNGVSLCGL